MKLIIVESPAKSRTIEKFLGKDYTVAASYGHIRDLPGSAAEIPEAYKGQPWARLGVNPEDDFAPVYVVSRESRKHVTALKKLMKGAEELLLATDEDREGEAISWHILEELNPSIPVRRITFHEITKNAIREALEHPREVDDKLVRAQESRRILDRLFGYELSPVLWKKVRTKLSAGRVQSVALRIVVEREEERLAFRTAEFWDLEADLAGPDGTPFVARLHEVDGKRVAQGKDFSGDTGELVKPDRVHHLDGDAARALAAATMSAAPWNVASVERKETRKRPSPPFITSTLQQAASSRLGMTPRRTMQVAQKLYEGVELGGGERTGLITYMRTDSFTLSNEALSAAQTLIRDTWGPEYTDGPRFYRSKSKSAQEAHEAIRPTDLFRRPESVASRLDKDELALYRLIWERTIASQMTDARLDRTTLDLTVAPADAAPCLFRATGSVVRFPGFLAVTGGGRDESILPELTEGDLIHAAGSDTDGAVLTAVRPEGHETSPPSRFTEASLIKRLEEAGIGRPSTYAPTISTILAREYVVKRKGSLVPTYVGMAVTRLLRDHFERYIDEGFTARMEDDLDLIASGEVDWKTFLHAFYHGAGDSDGLMADIAVQLPDIDYPAIPIGDEPETGDALTVRIGRTAAYLVAGEGDDARRATIPVDLLIDELTPDKARELLLAKERSREPLGQDPESGENIYVLVGPFGPYIQLGEVVDEGPKPKRVGLGRGTDPAGVDLEMALRLLSLPRVLGEDPESGKKVRAGLGRFGPYVECNRVYASVEDVSVLFTVTLDEALERIRNKNKKPVLKDLGPHPETGEPVQVLKGRYGPYVTDGTANATLKGVDDPTTLTMEQALPLLAEAATRKGKKKTRKKATTKKTTKKAAKKTTTKKTTKKAAKKTTKKKA